MRFCSASYEDTRKSKNQVFADFVSERIEFGTHELLSRIVNVAGGDGVGLHDWQVSEGRWREGVVSRMKDHGCSPQEIQRIEIMISYPTIAADHDVAMNEQKSILAERLGRLREIAERYADNPQAVSDS